MVDLASILVVNFTSSPERYMTASNELDHEACMGEAAGMQKICLV